MMEIVESRPVGLRGTPVLMCTPNRPGRYPCVILLHERYGLVQHTEDLARKMSAAGFVVCAPDLFYAYPDQAALHAGTVGVKPTDGDVLAQLEDAFALFASAPVADTSRLGLMGVCQTGRYPFVWAKHHALQACVTLYGAVGAANWEVDERRPWTLADLIAVTDARVLGIFGEKDNTISFSDVLRFRNALETANRSYQITIYADAPHGWLNDTMPERYRPEIARQAWDEVIAFLTTTLAGEPDASVVDWQFAARKHADYDFKKNVRL